MRTVKLPVELTFTLAMGAVLVVLSAIYHLPIRLPSREATQFVGVHYLVPLAGLLIWAGCTILSGRRMDIRPFALAYLCYAAILLVHFHLKLWAPIINPARFDRAFWFVDQLFHPLVAACFVLRRAILPIIPFEANFYMLGFVLMFYMSFCYHAVRTPAAFRTLILATLFAQGFGGLLYILTPAVGPFVYEPGINPYIATSQHFMLDIRRQLTGGGAGWLSLHEPQVLMAGLGAMPSLHVCSSFIFLRFAQTHGRPLLLTYYPIFAFIVVNAVASRWHYLVDLPAGLALACVSIWLARRCVAREGAIAARPAPELSAEPVPEAPLEPEPGYLETTPA